MEQQENGKFFSTSFKAGRRTYFFDVKKTKGEESYITITESKKFTDQETGDVRYEKHRIFIYKEDFDKFLESFNNSLNAINQDNTKE
jgi:hypothetical protein